jgi:LasA protease
VAFLLILSACAPSQGPAIIFPEQTTPSPTPEPEITPYPTRPAYKPGELVDYVAQTGDTLPALASHFNTTVPQIMEANPVIPKDVTTLPPGLPMKIPVYYLPLWGTPYQIIPDGLFVDGPAQVGFDTTAFITQFPGWLKNYREYAGDANRTGAEIVDYVAANFSISPRLLVAVLEYQAGALSSSAPLNGTYPLGYEDYAHQGVYLQLVWAANLLNNGYYGWRTGRLTQFDHPDGRQERPDPWQNAATVALQYYFSRTMSARAYAVATAQNGFAQTYINLFGDPWESNPAKEGGQPFIPGSLQQPALRLPFAAGETWNYTGGPHTGWGKGDPFAAIDFAPSGVKECSPSGNWVTAMADGIVVREDTGVVVLDLDGDQDEHTGWVLFYLHMGNQGKVQLGATVRAGDRLGHPSCEGGEATGTHVHIVRKYNGEWIPADGPLAFNLEGWVAHNGREAYAGTLTRFSQTVIASAKAEAESQITAGR